MFNVTIIRLKDIVKIIVILIIIFIVSKFIFKDGFVKENFNQMIHFPTSNLIKLGIDTESNLIKNITKEEAENTIEQTEETKEDNQTTSIKSILQIGSNLLKAKELENKLGQDENNNNTSESEEQKTAETKEVTTDVSTQVVTENPIAEKYNKDYNGVKIKNETSYDLTDEILNPIGLDIRTDNIILFHTHTCESYTPTESSNYTSSRKLSYHRFKLFSCQSRR